MAMRLPRMTTRRRMIRAAVLAVLLGLIRWNAALLSTAGLATFIPSFAWADTGGKLRRRDPARLMLEERLKLFAWAWLFSTIGLFGAVCLVSLIQGIRHVNL
jgi:hypothetical protein